jgi:hypothetical protein
MTDRFYPLGLPSDQDVWKSTYEVQNEMRAFERSAFPPGCGVHLPGARDKFGFSTPGPVPQRLAHPELCLKEETDIQHPRAIHAVPRYQVPNDREVFDNLDVPEMQRSYVSPVATMSFVGGNKSQMGSRSLSLPALQNKSVPRLREPNPPVHKLEDQQFSYFVPKQLARDGKDKLMGTNLSKLQKKSRITMPFGDGTGFRTQSAGVDWWPCGGYNQSQSTSYRDAHGPRPPFQRMNPYNMEYASMTQ